MVTTKSDNCLVRKSFSEIHQKKKNAKCMSKIRENSDHNEYFRVFCQFLKKKKIIVCSLFIHILSRDIELFVDTYISSNQGCRKRNYQSRFLW